MAKKNTKTKTKKFDNTICKVATLSIIFGIIAGVFGAYLFTSFQTPSKTSLMKQFYEMENATLVSPYDFFREAGKSGSDLLLVDLRTAEEFNKSHVENAVNVPATQLTKSEIIAKFKALEPLNKTIIIHCYSSYCMLATQVGTVLAENNIFVKHLDVGWAELNTQFSSHIVNVTSNSTASNLLSTTNSSTSCSVNKGFTC